MVRSLLRAGLTDALPFEDHRRVRVLNALSVAVIAAVAVFTAFDLATQGTAPAYLVPIHAGAVALGALTLGLHARRRYAVPPVLATLGHTAVCTAGSIAAGTPQTGRYYLIVVAVTAFVFYRSRWAVLAAFALPAAVFAFVDMGFGVVPRDLVRYGIFFAFLYVMVGAFVWENGRHLARIEQQRDALAVAHADLAGALDTVRLQASALRADTDRLGALNGLKDRALAVLGHDLRSPLAALAGVLDAYDDADLDGPFFQSLLGDTRRHLDAARGELDDVLGWASALLPSGADGGGTVDLAALVARAARHVAPRAEAKGVALAVDVPAGLAAAGEDGPVLLVLRNLLSNAVKFTPPGGRVAVEAEGDGRAVRLRVRDTGRGMTAADLAGLDGAGGVSRPGTDGERGTGLGLPLAREFADRLGGTLALASTPDVGTTATLTLRAPAPPAAPAPLPNRPPPALSLAA